MSGDFFMFRSQVSLFSLLFLLSSSLTLTAQAETKSPTQEQVASLGGKAAGTILQTFMSSLQGAMKEGGVMHAVSFCNTEVPAITKKVKATLPQGLKVKRATTQVRNPHNTPDEMELKALEFFTQEFKRTGSYPASYIQSLQDGYRFYKPLLIAKPCLSCHGDKAAMAPELRELILEKYPTDQATGYKEGDLRGVLRIEIPQSALTE